MRRHRFRPAILFSIESGYISTAQTTVQLLRVKRSEKINRTCCECIRVIHIIFQTIVRAKHNSALNSPIYSGPPPVSTFDAFPLCNDSRGTLWTCTSYRLMSQSQFHNEHVVPDRGFCGAIHETRYHRYRMSRSN